MSGEGLECLEFGGSGSYFVVWDFMDAGMMSILGLQVVVSAFAFASAGICTSLNGG